MGGGESDRIDVEVVAIAALGFLTVKAAGLQISLNSSCQFLECLSLCSACCFAPLQIVALLDRLLTHMHAFAPKCALGRRNLIDSIRMRRFSRRLDQSSCAMTLMKGKKLSTNDSNI